VSDIVVMMDGMRLEVCDVESLRDHDSLALRRRVARVDVEHERAIAAVGS